MVKTIIRLAVGKLPVTLRHAVSWSAMTIEGVLQIRRAAFLKKAGMRELELPKISVDAALTECHILGSGWSLNSSYSSIDRKKAFVIGFNFSFLKCSDPDLHFIENASLKNKLFFKGTLDHYYALKKFEVFEKTTVVFKNLSELKNSLRLIDFMYSDKAHFVRDSHFRLFGSDEIDSVIKAMMKNENSIPQAISSIISLIFLARLLGFRKIVVHGLDFYGPHFYGTDLNKAIYDNYDFSSVDMDFESMAKSAKHKTATGENGVGVREFLSKVKTHFADAGIEVVAASARSPSCEILGSRVNA